MNTVLDFMSYFIYGFIAGYFWNPIWEICKKIVSEAKIASKEWKEPNR